MRQIAILMAGLVLAGLPAFPDSIEFRIVDLTDSATGEFFKNGTLLQSTTCAAAEACPFLVVGSLGTTPALAIEANIDEPVVGSLSDTYSVISNGFGHATFLIDFESEIEGGPPLTPLLNNPQSIVENGLVQSVGIVTLSNGDTVNFTFQSDVSDVPEPASVGLLLTVLVGLGWTIHRRRRRLCQQFR